MLTHYIEISIRPDPEFTEPMLMSALLSKFHRARVELKALALGLSFPDYQRKPRTLGSKVRIHSDQESLEQLMKISWLSGMRDHLLIAEIVPVPDNAKHCVFTRKQFKTSAERIRRRRMRRKGEEYDQVRENVPDSMEQKPDLPFATLRSLSTGQAFPLFIDQGVVCAEAKQGSFNSYGLSAEATVPWF